MKFKVTDHQGITSLVEANSFFRDGDWIIFTTYDNSKSRTVAMFHSPFSVMEVPQ